MTRLAAATSCGIDLIERVRAESCSSVYLGDSTGWSGGGKVLVVSNILLYTSKGRLAAEQALRWIGNCIVVSRTAAGFVLAGKVVDRVSKSRLTKVRRSEAKRSDADPRAPTVLTAPFVRATDRPSNFADGDCMLRYSRGVSPKADGDHYLRTNSSTYNTERRTPVTALAPFLANLRDVCVGLQRQLYALSYLNCPANLPAAFAADSSVALQSSQTRWWLAGSGVVPAAVGAPYSLVLGFRLLSLRPHQRSIV